MKTLDVPVLALESLANGQDLDARQGRDSDHSRAVKYQVLAASAGPSGAAD
jgi:hypothetical protein